VDASAIHHVITDSNLSPEQARAIQEVGIQLTVV
jgi:DeoR/GlpR family transcriptional regulator of sugar metabolism